MNEYQNVLNDYDNEEFIEMFKKLELNGSKRAIATTIKKRHPGNTTTSPGPRSTYPYVRAGSSLTV